MYIKFNHWIFKLPFIKNYDAMVLYPFLLFKHSYKNVSKQLYLHELTHVDQINRVGVFKFYTIYLWDYFTGLWKYRNHDKAYRNVRWEKEAYRKASLK